MAFKMNNPLRHMGYKVKIQKGKVISEEKKPHNKFKTETEHEEYHDLFPAKPFTDAEGRPIEGGSPLDKRKRKRKRKRKPDVRRTIGPGKNFNKAKSTGTGGKAGGGDGGRGDGGRNSGGAGGGGSSRSSGGGDHRTKSKPVWRPTS